MTHYPFIDRTRVILALATSLIGKVCDAAGYIGFLLVADDTMPMFPGKPVSLES